MQIRRYICRSSAVTQGNSAYVAPTIQAEHKASTIPLPLLVLELIILVIMCAVMSLVWLHR